jgi:WD40 repeat protein
MGRSTLPPLPWTAWTASAGLCILAAQAGVRADDGAAESEPKPVAVVDTKGGEVFSLALSPDGKRLAAAVENGRRLQVWDMESGKAAVDRAMPYRVGSLRFSPDSGLLAVCNFYNNDIYGLDAKLTLMQPADGGTVRTLTAPARMFAAVEFSPDGKTLVSTELNAGRPDDILANCVVRIWDTASGAEKAPLKRESRQFLHHISFSPDGRHLLTAETDHSRAGKGQRISHVGVLTLWDLGSQTETLSVRFPAAPGFHGTSLQGVQFSQDGKRFATLRTHLGGGVVNEASVGDVDGLRMAWVRPIEEEVWAESLGFSKDGRTVYFWSRAALRAFDADTGAPRSSLRLPAGQMSVCSFSPNSARLAFGGDDGRIRVFDTDKLPDAPNAGPPR